MAYSVLHIAIDFGTSYSGYAISFNTAQSDQIMVSSWVHGASQKFGKTSTCILFDEKQNYLQFGLDALKAYTTSRHKGKKWYFFENFKMELYGKKINRDLMITAKNGAQMKAMTVFSRTLQCLKDHALNKIAQHATDKIFTASDVTWVLTIPAIWDPSGKQFMREAAIKAGLVTESNPERLIIALEPEAASVYCKQLPTDGFIAEFCSEETLETNPGTQYMVVDCGGGTIDITVHEVMEEGRLKELHAASGNGMGGEAVDRKFISFLRSIFSEEVFDEFEQEYPRQALKMKHEIELYKSYNGPVQFPCPIKLQEIAGRKQSIESYFEGVQGAEWEDGEILIEDQQLRSFFDDSLRATEDNLQKILLSNPELHIEYILLVGGFAECEILRAFLKEKFGSRQKILCPLEPQTAIIKGAVQYSKKPSVVKSRISACTYGVCTYEKFNKSIHNGKSTWVNSLGVKYCNVCFHQLVRNGESVLCDEVREFTRVPVETKQKEMRFTFYSTSKQNVRFVDEQGLKQIGSFTVSMPKPDMDMDRVVRLKIQFGSTEMKATAIDVESGETGSVKLDFMSTS